MEEAEHAFYRSLGASAFERTASGFTGMPRVSIGCDFLGPVRYGDELEVRLVLREKRRKVLRYEASFTRVSGGDDTLVARGTMTVVHARRSFGDEDWSGSELPAELLEQLEVREDVE